MKSALLSTAWALPLLLNGASAALDPIYIKGSKFFFKTNGTQFFIKGVAYQAGGLSGNTTGATADTSGSGNYYTDPLADTTSCKRDIPYLQKLGANTIRTYALDPTANHDECMAALDAAGIYLISDLSSPAPGESIVRDEPAWNLQLYKRYTGVVDAMQKYTNTIGFFAGNEVSNSLNTTNASAYVKAAVRDVKAYIAAKGYRPMGVGYAADDDQYVRLQAADYFNCGNASDAIDFWGYNIYEWCGNSNYELSGYAARTAEFSNYSVPSFFAEYGCNTQGGGAAGRKFTEVQALYGANMSTVFSGGIVYEYFQDPSNDYGLVTIESGSVSTMADYNAWESQIATVSPVVATASAYTPTNTAARNCPSVSANYWQVAPTHLPPTPNADVCNCMVAGLQCTAASGLSSDDITSAFGQVCGYNSGAACKGITDDTTTGSYGLYRMCNATQQLAYAFNQYYLQSGKNSQACNFNGQAVMVSPSAASSCGTVIAQATSAGGVTVPTGTGSGSGSASSASPSGKHNAGAVLHPVSTLSIGSLAFVTYIALALFSGAGLLLL